MEKIFKFFILTTLTSQLFAFAGFGLNVTQGIFTVNEKPNMGLARFKENFGASGIFRDTIELKLPI